jgi:hypothetical protein
MPYFLVTHRLGVAAVETGWRETLTALAQASHELGIRPVETFYSDERLIAYTLYEAPDAESIRAAHERARIGAPTEIVETERVHTDLLYEPRRQRFA